MDSSRDSLNMARERLADLAVMSEEPELTYDTASPPAEPIPSPTHSVSHFRRLSTLQDPVSPTPTELFEVPLQQVESLGSRGSISESK